MTATKNNNVTSNAIVLTSDLNNNINILNKYKSYSIVHYNNKLYMVDTDTDAYIYYHTDDDSFASVASQYNNIVCSKPDDFDSWCALNNMVLEHTYKNGTKLYTSDLELVRLAALNNIQAFLYNFTKCCYCIYDLVDIMYWLNGDDNVHLVTIVRDSIYYAVYNDVE